MNKLLKTAAAVMAVTAGMTTRAAAEVCVLFVCIGGSGGGGGGDAPAAPEISVTHGVAALAVLACAALFLRERFLRQRAG